MSDCTACGHPAEEHAEYVDNQTSSTKSLPERRQCLHGVTFVFRKDHRGGSYVSTDPRLCDCEKFQTNGVSK